MAEQLDPESPVSALRGIGPRRARALADRAIETVRDLVFHLPFNYDDWRERRDIRELAIGTSATVEGRITSVAERPMLGRHWRRLISATLEDRRGDKIRLVWFNLPRYTRQLVATGQSVLIHGRVSHGPDETIEIVQPDVASPQDRYAIRPRYNLPREIGQRLFAQTVELALAQTGEVIRGALPEELDRGARTMPLVLALRKLHQPGAADDIGQLRNGRTAAHRTLALDEMFAFQLALEIERERTAHRPATAFGPGRGLSAKFIERLPFGLTAAQERAISEIGAAMAAPRQMNRLLIGDVGSGKTVVALWAAVRAAESDYQAAIMAPTELLAEQHYKTFLKLSPGLGLNGTLLTSSVKGRARATAFAGLESGAVQIVFGTQALIQREVRMRRLGIAIIDEQHRFGVFDRARLKELGTRADMLLMSATPIPRSLALILFANLEISLLDEMPPGRVPVATRIFTADEVGAVDEIVGAEIAAGAQAYYVTPLIEGDDNEAPSVDTEAARLRGSALGAVRIGVIHGRFKSAQKERVMRQFRAGEIDLLVATTVIEVGIDVARASVMVIIAAERFGLAQLHQLRGRIGRGPRPSCCCLVMSPEADAQARIRLSTLIANPSGLGVAQADLEQRGPGDLFGARQTGPLPLRFARYIPGLETIETARAMAREWLRRDPQLRSPASVPVRRALGAMLSLGFSMGDIG